MYYYKIFLVFVALVTIFCSITAYSMSAAEVNADAAAAEGDKAEAEVTDPQFDPNSTFKGQPAYSESLGGFVYEDLGDGTCIIAGYNEKESNIIVPPTIGDLTVIGIGDTAFYGKEYLVSVVLPESVKTVGNDAFGDCTKLATFEMPGVTAIGSEAFAGCEMLRDTALPQTLVSIGDEAFRGCIRLGKLTAPASLTEIGIDAFAACESLIFDCTANEYAADYADTYAIPTNFGETGGFMMLIGAGLSAIILIGFAVVRKLTVKKYGK